MKIHRRLSAKPLVEYTARKLGIGKAFPDCTAETVVLCSEEKNSVAPAIYLEGQLDRVVGVAEFSSLELENKRIHQKHRLDGPTIAYRIDEAVFCNGSLLTNRMYHQQGGGQKRKPVVILSDELDEAVLPLSLFATTYFGHMIFDGGATSLLAPDFGPTYFDFHVASGMTEHVKRYWELFGLHFETIENVKLRHAWIFDDRGLNHNKVARIKHLNHRVRKLPGSKASRGVFVRRRGWGEHRAPANEAELEDFFRARGFEIVDPQKMNVDEIVSAVRDCEVLVGVEGSGMTHGILAMAPYMCVIMLFPPWRLNNMMKDYVDALDMRYGFVVGQGRGKNYFIDPEEIIRTIDLVRNSKIT